MTILEQVTKLAEEIRGAPGVRVELTSFPSGFVGMDVWWNEHFFVMQYLPSWDGFGVDEVRGDEEGGPFEPFHFGCHDFATAKQHLMELLDAADFPRPQAAAQEPHCQ